MNALTDFTSTLKITTCATCGMRFAMPSSYLEKLQDTHESFFCPAGHSLVFNGETKESKLRRQIASEQEVSKRNQQRAEQVARQLSAARGLHTRFRNRIKNGVCPCCRRSFANLCKHMKHQHPGYGDKV